MTKGKQYLPCKVLSVAPVTPEIFRLDCSWGGSAPHAGQFFMLKLERSGVFLPRPISAAFWSSVPGSPSSNIRIAFLILHRGRGTEELAALSPGEIINLSGPLGNCWEDFLPQTGRTTGNEKPAALIGGGIGIAPLLSLPDHHPGYFDFYAGFRAFEHDGEKTGLLGFIKHSARKLIIAVEKESGIQNETTEFQNKQSPGEQSSIVQSSGTTIFKGRIPDFLNPADYSAVYACGTEPMLRAVAEKCALKDIPCYVSLERRMACGTGACLGCTVRSSARCGSLHGGHNNDHSNGNTAPENRRCCTDGPIFPADSTILNLSP